MPITLIARKLCFGLENLKPDILMCFGWSNLIKKEVLEVAPMGVVGFHPTLLLK